MKFKAHAVTFVWLCSCCVSPPEYRIEPEIKFLSLSRNIVNQLDSVSVEFGFADGDGDLGVEDPDSVGCNPCYIDSCLHTDWNLYLTDTRKGCMDPKMLPYIPPKGSSDAISGKVNFVINSICCLYPDNTGCIPNINIPLDTVIYLVQIKDRAGHLSNVLELPPIIIRCN